MKSLQECKAYYIDVYMNWYVSSDRYGKELERLTMMYETLCFVYGDAFKKAELEWRADAIYNYFNAV